MLERQRVAGEPARFRRRHLEALHAILDEEEAL